MKKKERSSIPVNTRKKNSVQNNKQKLHNCDASRNSVTGSLQSSLSLLPDYCDRGQQERHSLDFLQEQASIYRLNTEYYRAFRQNT